MQDLAAMPWTILVVLGTVVVGLAIAYGMRRNKKVTPGEQRHTEAATHDLYKKDP